MNRNLGTLQFPKPIGQCPECAERHKGRDAGQRNPGLQRTWHGKLVRYHLWRRRQSGINVGSPTSGCIHSLINWRVPDRRDLPWHRPTFLSEPAGTGLGTRQFGVARICLLHPLITDPVVTYGFFGAQHVWRTQDNGGDKPFSKRTAASSSMVARSGACGGLGGDAPT